MMYEPHVKKGKRNFLFFEKGFGKLSLQKVSLRLEHRDEKTGEPKTSDSAIQCAWGCGYTPIQDSYGECSLSIAEKAMIDERLETNEHARMSARLWQQPYEI